MGIDDMASHQSDKFTLGMDDKTAKPTETFPQAYEAPPVEAKKISVALYLLLGILIVGIIAAYFDLYRRVARSKNTGTKDLTLLAQDLEDRFSSLSIRQAQLKEQLLKKISDDELTISGLKIKLKQARTDYNALKKQLTSKADQSKLAAALTTMGAVKDEIAKIDTDTETSLKKIDAMETELGTVKSGIRTTKENLSGEINEMNQVVDRSAKILIELESRMEKLDTAKIDKKTVANLIKKQLGSPQSTSAGLLKKISVFRDQINTNRRQITVLEKNARVYEGEILKLKRQFKSIQSGASKRTSKKATLSQSSAPSSPTSAKSGNFSQQNLNE
jgi:chromosome segregation ATPase